MQQSVKPEDVRALFEGKNVALVCSGPGSLENIPGFIDGHDVAVRVNNYKCIGPKTGIRTDVYYSFFGTSIRKKAEDLQRDGVKLCMCKCPNAQFMESEWHRKNGKMRGVDFRFIYEERKDWWFGPVYVPSIDEFMAHFNLLGGHVPTTGFAALLTILDFNPRSLYVTGMDFFQSRIHNLNERWSPGNPDDPIGHSPDAERAWLAANIDKYPIETDPSMAIALHSRVRARNVQSRVFRKRRRIPA